jgi:hypothetical protein
MHSKAQSVPLIAVDWLDGLIGLSGLLIIVSHLLQFQFQLYG